MSSADTPSEALVTPYMPQESTLQHEQHPPSTNPFVSLPAGWTTSVDPRDGQIFYWNKTTGKSSWTHPLTAPSSGPPVAPAARPSSYLPYRETPREAAVRPDNHQCQAVLAFILFPPLGLLALYHSYKVDQCWRSGDYSDAFMHARQAPQYASISICAGILLWIYLIFFAEPRNRDWFRFDGWGK